MRASQTELTATVAEVVPIDDKTSQSVDAYLDHDLFQELIEVDKHLIPVVHQNRDGFHSL
jgi:hypothetical protein